MLSIMGWIPIIGPIIDGIVSMFNKFQDKEIVGIQTAGASDIEAAKASVQIIHDTRDDIGVRLSRDLIIFPVAVWCAIGTWDTIVAHHNPELMYIIEKFPTGPLELLPHAVLAFLLGWTAMKAFRR